MKERLMNMLKTRLQDADPLRREVPALDGLRARVAAMPRESAPPYPPASSRRGRSGRIPAIALFVIALFAASYAFWTRGATPVFAAVRFEVHLAETQAAPGLVVARGPDASPLIYLHPEVVIDNDDIARAWVVPTEPGEFGVAVDVLPPGAERLRQATMAHVGRPVALVIDGDVVMAPVVRGAIGDSAVISGHYTREEAEKVARGLQLP
jgi:hypothetical protein